MIYTEGPAEFSKLLFDHSARLMAVSSPILMNFRPRTVEILISEAIVLSWRNVETFDPEKIELGLWFAGWVSEAVKRWHNGQYTTRTEEEMRVFPVHVRRENRIYWTPLQWRCWVRNGIVIEPDEDQMTQEQLDALL